MICDAHGCLLKAFPYLIVPEPTGNLSVDAIALMECNGKLISAAHSLKVTEVCVRLSERFGLDKEIMRAAGLLHDIGGVVHREDRLEYARKNHWQLDPAEELLPLLLHQRYSAILAVELFDVTDRPVLDAVACHSTLKPGATEVDMALFLADKIAWDREGTPPYLDILERALTVSLAYGSRVYLDYVMEHHMLQAPHSSLLAAWEWLRNA